eukprot:923272-Prymnesium_polylepis.1
MLQPCTHRACVHCCAYWTAGLQSQRDPMKCPVCRKPVRDIARDRNTERVLEMHLQRHPVEKKLEEEESELVDKKTEHWKHILRCVSQQQSR